MSRSNPNVIRANPLLATYQTLFILWFIVLGGLLGMLILGIVISVILSPGHNGLTRSPSFLSLYIVLFLCYIPSFVSTTLQWHYWKRIERRRLAASEEIAPCSPLSSP